MKETEVFRRLLQIEEPWNVDRVKLDSDGQELHAYLATGKSWFGKSAFSSPKMQWRHDNIGSFKTYIHATLPEDHEPSKVQPFLGGIDSDFTHGLARRVTDCLRAGLSYRQVCNLLGIDVHLAWQIRHKLDVAPGDPDRLDDTTTESVPETGIPPTGDPVWMRLLGSEQSLDIRLLGLRLLLARCQQEFPSLNSDDARLMRVNTVRRFFIKHEKHLGHEINQLVRLSVASNQGEGV